MQIENPFTLAIVLTIAILSMGLMYDDTSFAQTLNQTQYCHDHYSNLTVICHNTDTNMTMNLENILVK
jgi:hypothetical protein